MAATGCLGRERRKSIPLAREVPPAGGAIPRATSSADALTPKAPSGEKAGDARTATLVAKSFRCFDPEPRALILCPVVVIAQVFPSVQRRVRDGGFEAQLHCRSTRTGRDAQR